jgi:hypothetical protein
MNNNHGADSNGAQTRKRDRHMYGMAKRCATMWRETGDEYWWRQMLRYLRKSNNGCACDECVNEVLALAK